MDNTNTAYATGQKDISDFLEAVLPFSMSNTPTSPENAIRSMHGRDNFIVHGTLLVIQTKSPERCMNLMEGGDIARKLANSIDNNVCLLPGAADAIATAYGRMIALHSVRNAIKIMREDYSSSVEAAGSALDRLEGVLSVLETKCARIFLNDQGVPTLYTVPALLSLCNYPDAGRRQSPPGLAPAP